MIRHLLKLVWGRKRANGLIMLEIFLSFLVVFIVVSVTLTHVHRYRQPLGFEYENVWRVEMSTSNSFEWRRQRAGELERVRRMLKDMEEIEAAAAVSSMPYDGDSSSTSGDEDGRIVRFEYVMASPELADALSLQVVAGRWFERADLDRDWNPVVIDRRGATAAFGDDDPVGGRLPLGPKDDRYQVIGVVDAFRKHGELSEIRNFMFVLQDLTAEDAYPMSHFALRIAPGNGTEFEQRMVEQIQAIAPEWTAEVFRLADTREDDLKMRAAPLIALGVVAGFLLLMVALGLIGVLWQNVTQRTSELGLRRAIGAHRGNIHWQILTEVMLMTTIGLLLGLITVLQFPLLQLWGFASKGAFLAALGVATLMIYALAAVCGLYPGWLATRIQPAEALHHE